MGHRFLTFDNLRDKDGRVIPFHVQYFAFLIWTMPERGMNMRDYRKIFQRVGKEFGYRVGLRAALKFTRQTPRVGRVTRSWIRSEYYLDDLQMDRRQSGLFEFGLRGTSFDKMDRIRKRACEGVPFSKMELEAFNLDSLCKEILKIDLSLMPLYDDPKSRPKPGVGNVLGSFAL
jgi:hypothetical protein